MRYLLLLVFLGLTSCSIQKKINLWLDKNAAAYCMEKFPARELSDTVYFYTDSSVFYDTYMQTQAYADSLMGVLNSLDTTSDNKLVDSLRRSIVILKAKIKPCQTKVIVKRYEDSARVTYLTKELQIKTLELSQKEESLVSLKEQLKKQTKYLIGLGGLFVTTLFVGSRRMWKIITQKVVK